jgi:DNA-binding transcriptional regulator YiaG
MPRRRPFERPWRPKFDVPDDIDPRAVRQSLRKTQQGFASLIGVSLRTVQAWERRHWIRRAPGEDGPTWNTRYRRPTGAARVLLAMVERDPWVVYDVMTGQLSPDRG